MMTIKANFKISKVDPFKSLLADQILLAELTDVWFYENEWSNGE